MNPKHKPTEAEKVFLAASAVIIFVFVVPTYLIITAHMWGAA